MAILEISNPEHNLFLELDEVQRAVDRTAAYSRSNPTQAERVTYLIVGLTGETGELANKWKKHLRGDYMHFSDTPGTAVYIAERDGLIGEALDAFWYDVQLLSELGVLLSDAVKMLLDKLEKRQAEGKIHGSGDNR